MTKAIAFTVKVFSLTREKAMNNKWETNIEPYLAEIENWAMRGASGKEIAEKLNVSYATFRKYVNSKSELSSLLTRCEHHVKRIMEKALAAGTVEQKKNIRPRPEPATIYVKPKGIARPDQNGRHRGQFEKNKKIIYATQEVCGICGKPVDFSLKYPHPLSPCIDHIIPVAKGGHPSDISNLQLAHWTCNRQKSDKLTPAQQQEGTLDVISNRVLPQSIEWIRYRSSEK